MGFLLYMRAFMGRLKVHPHIYMAARLCRQGKLITTTTFLLGNLSELLTPCCYKNPACRIQAPPSKAGS